MSLNFFLFVHHHHHYKIFYHTMSCMTDEYTRTSNVLYVLRAYNYLPVHAPSMHTFSLLLQGVPSGLGGASGHLGDSPLQLLSP